MRRWPSAADEGAHAPVRERLNARYRRAYDGGNPSADRRRRQPSWAMQRLRSSPVRNGLIGLAIAGVGAPLGINRYQEALRTDSAHERMVAQAQAQQEMDDAALTQAWAAMSAEQRNAVIEAKLEENSEYRLTREMAEDIYEAAAEAEVDPDVAFGLVRAESSFRNAATSPVGAVGLTQLMPRTAAWMQPGVTVDELRDQKTNLRVGFKYLRYLVNKYDGDTRLALLAYNRGPGTVDKALKQGENPDNGYADFVAGKADHGHRLFTNAE